MRLSDIKGERALDVIADLIEPICSIAQDEGVKALMKKQALPQDAAPRAFAVDRLRKHVPALIKTHKADVIAILATIEGVTAEEYAQRLTLSKLLCDCVSLLNDTEFIELFISAQQETQARSGAARENIAEANK